MLDFNPLTDPALSEYRGFLTLRTEAFYREYARILRGYRSLRAYAGLHLSLGLHKTIDDEGSTCWRMMEYMPAASRVWLSTNRIGFELRQEYEFARMEGGYWQLYLPEEALKHGDWYEIRVKGHGSTAVQKRVPAFAEYVEQNPSDPNAWCARVWAPSSPHVFRNPRPSRIKFPRIYEAHVGMAIDSRIHTPGRIGTYAEFTAQMLPRIKAAGYTHVQLMGVPEHLLYKSFGYQVSSYFAPSSRFGTPDDFKNLVDEAHGLGLAIILDITHSHSCPNTEQGLMRYDTSGYLFDRRSNQWGTPSFDFQREMTRRFLLSNCRFWIEEYMVDGFRFDAVGNVIYLDHGIGDNFCHTGRCFYKPDGSPRENTWGEVHLTLANALVHEILPGSITIAEEFSGMPGLTCTPEVGGLGFDYRFAMGIPDFWSKFIKKNDTMEMLWYEMTNHRGYDRTINYVECHDQCINGDDAMIWRLLGDSMYTRMSPFNATWNETRGVALYRLIRAITLASADAGYLNFMGAEFGHPEWLDDDTHAHRQWMLAEDETSFYASLARWDKALMKELIGAYPEAFSLQPIFRCVHQDNRLLAFTRGDLLFTFNFHETRAENEFLIRLEAGSFIEIMSSDEPRFGGHGNLDPGRLPIEHFSDAESGIDWQDLKIYLPPMTMLILRRANAGKDSEPSEQKIPG